MNYVQTEPLNALAREINAWAVGQGFYDPPRDLDSHLMLIVSEAVEALEHWRDGHAPNEVFFHTTTSPVHKPDGVPVELADILIRTLDTMAHYNLDIDSLVEQKMTYNRTRPHRNGGKRS